MTVITLGTSIPQAVEESGNMEDAIRVWSQSRS